MNIHKPFKKIFFFKTASYFYILCILSILINSCALPGWDTDLKAFVETGLSTAYLKSARYAQEGNETNADVRSGVPVTVTVLLNNPKDLALDYTLGYDETLVEGTAAAPANTTATTNSVTTATFTFTPTEAAEHGDISFSLGMDAPALGKIFTPATFTVHCDSPPDPVNNLTAGVQADNRACIGFTLPENVANGDISAVEITYKNDATGATKTVTKETGQKGTGLTVVPSPALLDSNIAKYIRYYIPEDVVAGNPYTFTVVTVDASGKKSVKATTPAQVSVTGNEVFLGYDTNGGTGSVAAKYGFNLTTTTTIATGASLSKTDSAFTGWNTKADGSGTPYTPGVSYTFGSTSLMLYAQWHKLASASVSITMPNYQAVTVAQNGTSSVTMDKDGTLTLWMIITTGASDYQWYLNGALIVAATAESYSFTPSAAGTYTISATAISGEVFYSGNVTVTVTDDYMVTILPNDKTVTYEQKTRSYNDTDGTWSPLSSFMYTLSSNRPFSMAKYEVSYGLWTTVCSWASEHGYTNLSAGGDGYHCGPAGPMQPVLSIFYFDAIVWCNAYSEMMGYTPCYYNSTSDRTSSAVARDASSLSNLYTPDYVLWAANGYRLPTEGEWHYAASCGGYYAYDQISGTDANVGDGTGGTVAVNSLSPNIWGMYCMSGNVAEYCFDLYNTVPSTPRTDYICDTPDTAAIGTVVCGGAYDLIRDRATVGIRYNQLVRTTTSENGFRLARTITQ